MENTSRKLSSSPERKKMKMEGPGEEDEEGEEEMEEGGGGQEPEEEEIDEEEEVRQCSYTDRAAWRAYRDGGRTDHMSARELVNGPYAPLKRMTSDLESPQGMRHNAESEFFNIRNKSVRDLLREITKHQYRDPADKVPPIDLTGKSARYVIATDRLQQETWITLSIGEKIRSGIPCARSKSYETEEFKQPLGFGPEEVYEAKFERPGHEVTERVVSEHRTEISDTQKTPPPLPKLGNSLVRHEYYHSDREIYDFLEKVIVKLEGSTTGTGSYVPMRPRRRSPSYGRRRLADLFIQFAHTHSLAGAPELSDKQRGELFKICFLVMVKNQAMWQGCFFDKSETWRLGMSVSFARLIILFREGVIQLNDVFIKYGIYSNYGGILMIKSNKVVKSRCDAIDKEYIKYKKRPLTELDATDDLGIVYGGVGSLQEKRYEAEREYFHDSFLRAYPPEGDSLPDVGSYKAELEKYIKELGRDKQGQRRLAELFIGFRPNHPLSLSEAEASKLDKEKLSEIFTAMWRVHWLWQWGSYERKLWPLGLTVSFARLVILFREGEITLDYVFEACGISTKHDSVASVRKKCSDIDTKYADTINERGIKLTKLDAINDLRQVYGEDVKWNYPEKPCLPTSHNNGLPEIEEALEPLPAGPAMATTL